MFSVLGTPTEQNMPNCTKQKYYHSMVREHGQPRRVREHLKSQLVKGHLMTGIEDGASVDETLTDHWFDLIDSMLTLDPQKRPSANQILHHPFFTSDDVPKACLPEQLPVNQMDDSHQFITKAERSKQKDFRKSYTFRHNLDLTNYNSQEVQ